MTDMQCDAARNILKEAPLNTSILEKGRTEQTLWDAMYHYASCPSCRPMGLAEIRGKRMYCPEAIVAAVAGKDLLFMVDNNTCTTLGEVMAHEHIYGVTAFVEIGGVLVRCAPKSVHEGLVDPGMSIDACQDEVCSRMRRIWVEAPLCAHYDGDNEVAHGIEQTLDIAQAAGWNLDDIVRAAPAEKLGKFQQLLLPV